jgi:O-antigen biosynthesis protein
VALATYEMNYTAILNSRFLADFFHQNRVGRFRAPGFFERSAVLEITVDRSKFYFEARTEKRKKKRLVFYARPTRARRNLCELGVTALLRAAKAGIVDAKEWYIVFMDGENVPPIDLGKGMMIQCIPWKSHDDYARTLRESDIALSLMLSPHPSYPPLEAAASGAVVVTNTYDCKSEHRLKEISGNIIPINPSLSAIVDGLREAVRRASDLKSREEASRIHLPQTWDESFDRILPRSLEMFEECRATT